MLEVADLVVRYGKAPAVSGVSLAVGAAEIICLVGPNGAGKSTTLMTIAGELKPSSGSIRLDGQEIGGAPVERIVSLGVSLVPENRHIFGRMTVLENLRLATFMRSNATAAREDLERVIRSLPLLAERRNAPAGRLSGGEQQQLAIARGLLTAPKLLMVDEPSLGLAPLMVEQIYNMLLTARAEGLTLIVVEQSLERALSFADRIYIIRGGGVRLEGTAAELAENPAAEDAYFGTENVTLDAAP